MRKIAESAACKDDALGEKQISIRHSRNYEHGMFNTRGGEMIPIMYKKAIVEQYLYCSSTILLDLDLSPSNQLFIKRPG